MSYIYESPAGIIEIFSDGEFITALKFAEFSEKRVNRTHQHNIPSCVKNAMKWLDVYFSGKNPGKTPPMGLSGTEFQKTVLKKVSEIPYGETVTYGELAKSIASETGKPTSARAVGRAVGSNKVLLLVPCHRVMGKGGKITGYSAGTEIKQYLLRLEMMGNR